MYFTKMHGLGNDYLYVFGEVRAILKNYRKSFPIDTSVQARTE